MSGDNESRRRLRPWLEAKINGGTIPGLYWVDEEKTMFRVPWKHAGKQDWSPEQSTLFMEWAKHTGRYREGVDEPDYATWKTRLRCAFNKAPDIEEMKHMTDLDASQPFRVYKFLPKKTSKRLPGLNGSQFQQESTLTANWNKMEPMELNTYMQQANLNPKLPQMLDTFNRSGDPAMSVSGSMPSDLKSIPSQDILRPYDGTAQLEHLKKEIADEDQNMDSVEGMDGNLAEKRQYPSDMYSGMRSTDNAPQFIDLSSLQESLPESSQAPCSAGAAVSESTQWFAQHSPAPLHQSQHLQQQQQLDYMQAQLSPASHTEMSPTPGTDYYHDQNIAFHSQQQLQCNLPDVASPTLLKMVPNIKSENSGEMHIVLHYLNNEMDKWLVTNPDGCRISYVPEGSIQDGEGQDNTEQLPAAPMDELKLPDFQLGSNPQYAMLATQFKKLHENLERGILLQCRSGDVYAKRLCMCKIYYTPSSDTQECINLPRNEWTKVFDYNRFKQEIDAYRRGMGSFPNIHTCLWIGQRVSPGESLSKILMSVDVVGGAAVLQQHMVKSETPSSCYHTQN